MLVFLWRSPARPFRAVLSVALPSNNISCTASEMMSTLFAVPNITDVVLYNNSVAGDFSTVGGFPVPPTLVRRLLCFALLQVRSAVPCFVFMIVLST